MIWDSCLVQAVAAELQARLTGSRARSIAFERYARRLTINFRECTLVADLSPEIGTVLLGPAAEPADCAKAWPTVLRSVEALPDERIMVLRFKRVRGKRGNPALILDLATNRWNALLVEGDQLRVVKRLRSLRGRTVRVGQPWQAPAEGKRVGSDGRLSLEDWKKAVGELWESDQSEEGSQAKIVRADLLVKRVAFASPINAEYLLASVDAEEGFSHWCTLATMEELAPSLLELKTAPQPYPWPLDNPKGATYESVLEAMAAAQARVVASREPGKATSRGLAAFWGQQSRRAKRRLKRLRVQLGKTERAEELRRAGNLILASLHQIPTGAERVTLTDFDGGECIIDLDPSLRPQEYANVLFRKATRLDRGAASVRARIAEVSGELTRIVALRRRFEGGEISEDELSAQLVNLPSWRHATETSKASRYKAAPFRRYRSSGGLEIRVGRGARHNDDLTFRNSRPNDIWLHARHTAGAHVILCWPGSDRPPARDLEEAAILAANHSRARSSAHVPVDWTRRKYVRKPRGSPPGTVTPARVETLFVTPDPALDERLAWKT